MELTIILVVWNMGLMSWLLLLEIETHKNFKDIAHWMKLQEQTNREIGIAFLDHKEKD